MGTMNTANNSNSRKSKNNNKIIFNEQLLCAQYFIYGFKWIIPFNFLNNSMRKIPVLFLFYR